MTQIPSPRSADADHGKTGAKGPGPSVPALLDRLRDLNDEARAEAMAYAHLSGSLQDPGSPAPALLWTTKVDGHPREIITSLEDMLPADRQMVLEAMRLMHARKLLFATYHARQLLNELYGQLEQTIAQEVPDVDGPDEPDTADR